jgi:NADH dehydrogenase
VAGGTGFLGAAFVQELVAAGGSVAVLSRRPEAVSGRFPDLAVEGRFGDVTRPESLAPSLLGVETLVQCVQFPGFPVEAPRLGRTFMEVDAKGTQNVISAARDAGVRKVVYLSGVGADSEASQHWFRAKAIAEEAVSGSGLAYVIVRPSWVYGPGDRSLNRFVDLIRTIPFFFPQLGTGTQRINPVFVADVAALVGRAVRHDAAAGATIEIGGPVTYSMDHIIDLLMETLGRRRSILHTPLSLAMIGAAVAELVPAQLMSRDALRFVVQEAVADNAELHRLFPDLTLTSMPEALRSYLGQRDG